LEREGGEGGTGDAVRGDEVVNRLQGPHVMAADAAAIAWPELSSMYKWRKGPAPAGLRGGVGSYISPNGTGVSLQFLLAGIGFPGHSDPTRPFLLKADETGPRLAKAIKDGLPALKQFLHWTGPNEANGDAGLSDLYLDGGGRWMPTATLDGGGRWEEEGYECNGCAQAIQGIRYHSGSSVDYDLCETCHGLKGRGNEEGAKYSIYGPFHEYAIGTSDDDEENTKALEQEQLTSEARDFYEAYDMGYGLKFAGVGKTHILTIGEYVPSDSDEDDDIDDKEVEGLEDDLTRDAKWSSQLAIPVAVGVLISYFDASQKPLNPEKGRGKAIEVIEADDGLCISSLMIETPEKKQILINNPHAAINVFGSDDSKHEGPVTKEVLQDHAWVPGALAGLELDPHGGGDLAAAVHAARPDDAKRKQGEGAAADGSGGDKKQTKRQRTRRGL
jgi:hypothetical protein